MGTRAVLFLLVLVFFFVLAESRDVPPASGGFLTPSRFFQAVSLFLRGRARVCRVDYLMLIRRFQIDLLKVLFWGEVETS